MIIEEILKFFALPCNLLIDALPTFSIEIPQGAFDTLMTVVKSASYVIPFQFLLPILAISFGLKTSQIVWAIIIRVKSFIPTMGA